MVLKLEFLSGRVETPRDQADLRVAAGDLRTEHKQMFGEVAEAVGVEFLTYLFFQW